MEHLREAIDPRKCPADALSELTALAEEVGTDALRGPLETAYRACGDDGALADLWLGLDPQPDRDRALQVGAALIRATRYDDAVAVLKPFVSEPESTQLVWAYSLARATSGDLAGALPYLRASRAHSKGSDAHVLIASALLDTGDAQAALEELERGETVEGAKPESVYPLLARAYSAVGRNADAEEALEKARLAHEAILEREQIQYRLSAQSTALQRAWKAGRTEETARLVEAMWPHSPPAVRVMLQEYRIALHDKAGREREAEQARVTLREMKEAMK